MAKKMVWSSLLLLWLFPLLISNSINTVDGAAAAVAGPAAGGPAAEGPGAARGPARSSGAGGERPVAENSNWPAPDNNTIANVTVQLGGTAYLHCRVRALLDSAVASAGHVSWIRRRDWHILSSGMFTYTNDERFQVMHGEGSNDWILQIKFVQKRDNGTYECQVSTTTGLVAYFVSLHIVIPEAYIQGSPERHVDVGSDITLVCVIDKSPTPPAYVFWYHNDRMINYDTSRSGITVETVSSSQTKSLLTIRSAHDADSGNYTCSASNTDPASIYVFVEEGDKMASLLKKSVGSYSNISSQMLLFIVISFMF